MAGIFTFLQLLITLSVAAAQSESVINVSFEDLPKLIRERNRNVTGTAQFVGAAEVRTGHLLRSYLPTLKTAAGGEAFQTGPYSTMAQPYGEIEASINLYRGGKDLLEESIRTSHIQIAESNSKKIFLSELTEARKTYWTLVFMHEMIAELKEAVQQNEQNLAMANRRIERGLGTETDRLEFQIYHSQLEEEIESLQHGLKLVQIRFAALIGFDQDTQFKTIEKIIHEHDEAILATKYDPTTHPDVNFAKANYKIFSVQKSQANRWWTPSLDVYGGYFLYTLRDRDSLSQRDRFDLAGGIKLTFELFDGYQSKTNANSFALQAQGYEQLATQRARTAGAQVEVAKEDLKHDHDLIHWAEQRIIQGKKYLDRTRDEYNRGVKNSIDVLGAAQKYMAFKRQYAERRRDFQITKSGLLALIEQ